MLKADRKMDFLLFAEKDNVTFKVICNVLVINASERSFTTFFKAITVIECGGKTGVTLFRISPHSD